MGKYRILTAALTAALMLASCSREHAGGGGVSDASVTVLLDVPVGPSTRALTADQQQDIKYIDILLFDSGLELVRWEKGVIQSSPSGTMFTVKLPLSTSPADTYRMLVLANAHRTAHRLFSGADLNGHNGKTYAQVRLLLETAAADQGTYAADGIPMWGEFATDFTVERDMPARSLTLLRSVARIDVGTNENIVTDPVTGEATYARLDNFSLEEVYVYRANKSLMLAPERSRYSFTDHKVSGLSLPAAVDSYDADDPQGYSGSDITRDGTVGISLTGSIYCPEADVDMKGGAGALYDDKHFERMAIVVGGYYKPQGASGFNGTLSYYRIDLTSGDNTASLHDILRNHCYQMVIKKVTGPGVPDPDEAYGSYVSQLEAEVLTWTDAPQNTVIDGPYRMRLSRDMVYCGSEGTDAGVEILAEITSTNTGAGLTVADVEYHSGAGGWLVKDVNYFISATTDRTVDGQAVKHVTVTVKDIPANTSGSTREARLLVRSGNMRYEYRIVQDSRPWLTWTDDVLLMDGTVQELEIDALTEWTVGVKDNGYNNIVGGENVVSRIVSNRGEAGPGAVLMRTLNDIFRSPQPLIDELQSVTFTFRHPDGYITRDVTVDFASGLPVDPANCYMTDGVQRRPVPVPVFAQVKRAMRPADGGDNGVANQVNNEAARGVLPAGWLTGVNLRAAVLWSDRPLDDPRSAVVRSAKITGSSPQQARLVVTPGTAQGNAVVIMYDDKDGDGEYNGADEIKWSWHIWNTDDNPGDGRYTAIPARATSQAQNGPVDVTAGKVYRHDARGYTPAGTRNTVFMDRNLGATPEMNGPDVQFATDAQKEKTFGLYYQWGRKDPMPPVKLDRTIQVYTQWGITIPTLVSNTTINNLARSMNPALFMGADITSNHHWFTNSGAWIDKNDNLWGGRANGDTKTVFDPCPPGWRVPNMAGCINSSGGTVKQFRPSPFYAGYNDGIAGENPNSYAAAAFDKGYFFDGSKSRFHMGWYPAAGAYSSNANVTAPGSIGACWGATTESTDVRSLALGLNSTSVRPVGAAGSVLGYSVRCVAE